MRRTLAWAATVIAALVLTVASSLAADRLGDVGALDPDSAPASGHETDAQEPVKQPRVVPPLELGRDWRLVLDEDFDGPLDRSTWTTCYWWAENDGCTNLATGEEQWFVDRNVRTSDGVLELRAEQESVTDGDGRVHPYTSGMVTTGRSTYVTSGAARFAFKYGHVEVRMRMAPGQGLWSAVWMLPVNHEPRPEIDIVEMLGHEPDVLYFVYHYAGGADRPRPTQTSVEGVDGTDWHTYTLRWRPHRLIWQVDGRTVKVLEDPERIPQTPMYLLIDLAVGGDWAGAPDDSTVFPARTQVQYVRVWKRLQDASASGGHRA